MQTIILFFYRSAILEYAYIIQAQAMIYPWK